MKYQVNIKVLLSLALFSTLLLFIISPDSYTHDLFGRCDSAWFFMCGKAWMEGLTPYVDFSDSKGPLLWVIYGIGYLISPYNYIGIFWISCLIYVLIFYFTYLIANIFLKDNKKSAVCAVLMSFAYFFPYTHYETRAEDFCNLFILLPMYRVCLLFYESIPSKRSLYTTFFILGSCFSALVLIKFNYAAGEAIFILLSLWWLWKNKTRALLPIVWMIIGLLVVALPFIFYFLSKGCFNAFITEYFINTLSTVKTKGSFFSNYLYEWTLLFTDKYKIITFIPCFIGCILIIYKLKRYKLLPLISYMLFMSICIKHSIFIQYLQLPLIWSIFLFIVILKKFNISLNKATYIFICLCSIVIISFGQLYFNGRTFRDNYFVVNNVKRSDFYTNCAIVSKIPKATIANVSGNEVGIGITSKTLPAGKYWVLQHGASPQMIKEHSDLILFGKPDFVIFCKDERHKNEYISLNVLKSKGYHIVNHWGAEWYLLTRHNIGPLKHIPQISNMDVLLKHKPNFSE